MIKITASVNLDSPREAILNLQDALRFLLQKGAFRLSDDDQAGFLARLSAERASYGSGTKKLVGMFQEQHNLPVTGTVDERTAPALNTSLDQLGGFAPQPADQPRLVVGGVRREDGQPVRGMTVRALHSLGNSPIRLGEELTDSE